MNVIQNHTISAYFKESTVMVKDICPINDSSSPSNLTNINGTLFFCARNTNSWNRDDDYGVELWKSNGTSSSTVMVKDINPGTNHSYPRELINMNGTLFFVAYEKDSGYELWKSIL